MQEKGKQHSKQRCSLSFQCECLHRCCAARPTPVENEKTLKHCSVTWSRALIFHSESCAPPSSRQPNMMCPTAKLMCPNFSSHVVRTNQDPKRRDLRNLTHYLSTILVESIFTSTRDPHPSLVEGFPNYFDCARSALPDDTLSESLSLPS